MAKNTKETASQAGERELTREELLEMLKAADKAVAAAEKEKEAALDAAEKAKAEAAELAAAAEAKADTGIFIAPADAEQQKREEMEKYLKEEVTIELFKDNERYKDDVFVAVNGKTYQIKRGVPVKVPRNVSLVLERSRKQDLKTTEMIQEKAAEYKAKEKHLT